MVFVFPSETLMFRRFRPCSFSSWPCLVASWCPGRWQCFGISSFRVMRRRGHVVGQTLCSDAESRRSQVGKAFPTTIEGSRVRPCRTQAMQERREADVRRLKSRQISAGFASQLGWNMMKYNLSVFDFLMFFFFVNVFVALFLIIITEHYWDSRKTMKSEATRSAGASVVLASLHSFAGWEPAAKFGSSSLSNVVEVHCMKTNTHPSCPDFLFTVGIA